VSVDFNPTNLTNSLAPLPYVVAASSYYNAGAAPWKVFDGSTITYWIGTGSGVDWINLFLGGLSSKYILQTYKVKVNAVPEATRAPKDWTVLGSNDGITWDTLDTVANQTSWGSAEERTFTCDVNTTAYRWFKISITANNGDATYTQIAVLTLNGDEVIDNTQFAPHDLTSLTSHSPFVVDRSTYYTDGTHHWYAWHAFNDTEGIQYSYWLGSNNGVDWLSLDIGSGNFKILTSYIVQTHKYAEEPTNCPKDWTMEGSNNGTVWTTLDTVTNQTSWTAGEARAFFCDTTNTAYRYFRLNISANNGSATYTQVGKLYLYGLTIGDNTGLTYPILSLLGTGYLPITAIGEFSTPLFSISGTNYLPPTATGGLSIPLFSTAGLISCLLITGGLSFTFELTGSGRNINGQGGPTLPRFSQSLTGMVTYDQGGLAYRMTLAAAGAVSMPGSGGLALPMFSLSGEGYEHNQTLSDEEYLRRSLNDTVGLSLDQSPVTPTYIEPADNATTDYLKNFLGVGH
jgi:hypothetical protein